MNTWRYTVTDNILAGSILLLTNEYLWHVSLKQQSKPNHFQICQKNSSLWPLAHYSYTFYTTRSECHERGCWQGSPHGSSLFSCRSIDLSINQCEVVQNEHSTGKVIGMSEPAELAQINRSLNRLFLSVIWHDAWENRWCGGPAQAVVWHRCNS